MKINTDPAVGVGGSTNQQTSDRSRLDNQPDGLSLTVGSFREDDGISTDDASDSGTAGTPNSQTAGYWSDLEVLDPDHPM